MLAIVYLVAVTYFGDLVCRRFFRFNSIQHRVAAGFLVGLLLSTWIVFLSAVLFHRTSQPLIAGNLVFLVLVAVVVLASRHWPSRDSDDYSARPPGHRYWDFVWLGACLVFACWLMFATLGFKDGQFQIAFKAWTDFGANVSLTQSFALGKNFPPQHPFFRASSSAITSSFGFRLGTWSFSD
jgi:hypothetical protein